MEKKLCAKCQSVMIPVVVNLVDNLVTIACPMFLPAGVEHDHCVCKLTSDICSEILQRVLLSEN